MTQPALEIAKQIILIVDDDEAVRVSLRSSFPMTTTC